MNRNFRIIHLLLMLLSTIILFIFVVFAWYASLEKTEPIIINTGSLKADCLFYRGLDPDFDGVFEEWEEITEDDLSFSNVIPGQIYTFKLSISNSGTVSGFLSVSIDDIITDEEDLLAYFLVNFQAPTARSIPLSDANSGQLSLFNDYILEAKNSFDFIFQIRVGNISGNIFHLKSLTISHFIVDLIQVHDQQ